MAGDYSFFGDSLLMNEMSDCSIKEWLLQKSKKYGQTTALG
jgi:hypothetical protein